MIIDISMLKRTTGTNFRHHNVLQLPFLNKLSKNISFPPTTWTHWTSKHVHFYQVLPISSIRQNFNVMSCLGVISFRNEPRPPWGHKIKRTGSENTMASCKQPNWMSIKVTPNPIKVTPSTLSKLPRSGPTLAIRPNML